MAGGLASTAQELTAGDCAWLVACLQGLIRIDSAVPGPGERELARHVAGIARDLGAEVDVIEALPGRPSVAAWIGPAEGPRLVLNGHLDTVPVGDVGTWTVPPLEGRLIDGLIHGRGACDMKAGLAVILFVLRDLAHVPPAGRLIAHFAVGEERGEPGTASLLAAGHAGDAAIVLEPTQLAVGTAHRGVVRFEIEVAGPGGHAGLGEQLPNPVEALGAMLDGVGRYRRALAGRSHVLLGAPLVTPTIAASGTAENVVPTGARLVVDRRLLPGEGVERERAHLRAAVTAALIDAGWAGPAPTATIRQGTFPPFETAGAGRVVPALVAAHHETLGEAPRCCGLPYATDAGRFAAAGVDDVAVYGPGSIAHAHRADERVDSADLVRCAAVVRQLARRWLTGDEQGPATADPVPLPS